MSFKDDNEQENLRLYVDRLNELTRTEYYKAENILM